jgi:hypothetical protein
MKRFVGLLAVWPLLASHHALAAGPFQEKDFAWDPLLEHYKAVVMAGVNKVARDNPEQCAKIDPKSVQKYGGTPDDPIFEVTCGDAEHHFQVRFSKTDVTGDPALEPPKQ